MIKFIITIKQDLPMDETGISNVTGSYETELLDPTTTVEMAMVKILAAYTKNVLIALKENPVCRSTVNTLAELIGDE